MMDEEFLARIEKFWPIIVTRRIHFPEPQDSSLDIALAKAHYDRLWAQDQEIIKLRESVETLSSNLADLESRFKFQNELNRAGRKYINDEMYTMDENINKLRRKIFSPEPEIDSLSRRIHILEEHLETYRILIKGAKKDVDKLKDRVNNIESVANSADTDINALEDRVNTNEGDVSELGNRVTDLEQGND
jgi:chromosome segregation ATPase